MSQDIAMYPFEYALDHDGLKINCGQFCLSQISYDEIQSIKAGFHLLALNWCNLLPFEFLTINLNKGLIRKIVINPPDPKAFSLELEERRLAFQSIRNRNLVPA